MALITSAGVGSGLDLESIIQATLNAEDAPKLEKFNEIDQQLNVELSAIGAIKSSLSALDDVIAKLADIDNFNKRTSEITQPSSGDLISVTTSSESTPGDFNIEVMQLAQGSRAVSGDGLFTDTSDVVTASGGNLTITAGTDSFVVNVAAGATLEELREAINDADDNFGVSVNIINTGSESKLVVTSSTSGAGNDVSITNDTAELDNVSTVANGGGAGGLAIAAEDAAQDAIIEIDGISVSSDTNTFADAIEDMTIRALKESESGETAKLSVMVDSASVENTLTEFIDAYNNAIGTIDYHTQAGAPLFGDSQMRSLQGQMVNALTKVVSGAGNYETLFDVGIGLNKEGQLEKSSIVRSINEALTENYDDVGTLFASADGVASNFASLLDNYVETDGSLKYREDYLNQEIKDLETDVDNHTYRMEQLEARLRQQYASLDVLIAGMQSTGSYLASQLASLPGFKTSSKS